MKVLLTGAGGFVAYHFLEFLKKSKIDVDVFGVDIADNLDLNYPLFTYKKLNLTDFSEVYNLISNYKPDYILHLASVSSVSKSWQAPVESFVNNTNIFLNIVESIRLLKLNTKVLSIGSSEEYGNYPADKMPLKEEYNLCPCSPYAIARVSQEMISKLYAKEYGLNVVMTRSFNHIGPNQRDVFVIPSFVKQLIAIKNKEANSIKVGNIEIIRDFLDVRDVVSAYWKLLLNGKSGEIYNVCSGEGIKLSKIIEIVSNELQINPVIEVDSSRIRPDDNMCIIGDNSKIKNELNWRPEYKLEDTLKDVICRMDLCSL